LIQINATLCRSAQASLAKESAMPIESLVVVSLIITVFVIFGVVLACGEYQTRHLDPPSQSPGPEQQSDQGWLKAA
jgi:hypothetical protein